VKRLVLTSAGLEMKDLVEQEVLARAPWRRALTVEERTSLVELMHKMTPPRVTDADGHADEVTGFASTVGCPGGLTGGAEPLPGREEAAPRASG
jgi:hypothetical protein